MEDSSVRVDSSGHQSESVNGEMVTLQCPVEIIHQFPLDGATKKEPCAQCKVEDQSHHHVPLNMVKNEPIEDVPNDAINSPDSLQTKQDDTGGMGDQPVPIALYMVDPRLKSFVRLPQRYVNYNNLQGDLDESTSRTGTQKHVKPERRNETPTLTSAGQPRNNNSTEMTRKCSTSSQCCKVKGTHTRNSTETEALAEHGGTNLRDKQYKCSSCEYSCDHKGRLVRHERSHNDEKPFNCSVCSKTFKHKESQVAHEKLHMGGKPYQCSLCPYSSARKPTLKRHEICHKGGKRYNCSVCGYSCDHKWHLVRHERTHTDQRPYSCAQNDSGIKKAS